MDLASSIAPRRGPRQRLRRFPLTWPPGSTTGASVWLAKPLRESSAEVDYSISYLSWYAAEAVRPSGTSVTEISATKRGIQIREPVGVCVILTPFNFPLAMVVRKVAAGLAAGCACIVKPSPETPLTCLALAALAKKAGVPSGVLNVVVARELQTVAVVERLLQSEPVRLVSFTGSSRVGAAVSRIAADRALRTCLELGSSGAPFIIFDDANVDAAVDCLMRCKFRASGQACIAADRVFVQEGKCPFALHARSGAFAVW